MDRPEPDGFVPLDERARTLFHLQSLSAFVVGWVPATAVGVGLSALALGLTRALVLGGIWLALQGLLALWWPLLSFPRWGWRLEPEVLLIRRGVLFRTVVAIPRSRIQHVDVRQGPFEQLIGLARIQIHTASGLGADGWIPGLGPDDAERLRRELTTGPRSGDGV